jgi:peptide-methionine (R)-S-oxide reductase
MTSPSSRGSCPSRRTLSTYRRTWRNSHYIDLVTYEVEKSKEEWRQQLGRERYAVLREAATERAFTGSLLHEDEKGVFSCGGCGQELFTSEQKFDSGTGWPSFDDFVPGTVIKRVDWSLFGRRTEVHCARCGGHLGHVFKDGPTKTGLRYCINSASIDFKEAET